MRTRTLRAHYDGRQIIVDEPYEFEPDTKLIIIVQPKSVDEDRRDWELLSLESLDRAYGDDEPEYSSDQIKEPNPDYERR